MGHRSNPMFSFPSGKNSEANLLLPSGSVIDGDIDALSGLATRRRLLEHLNTLLLVTMNGTTPPALILLGLNRFKAVNDSLGPLAGDELLFRVSQRLRSQVPQSTLTARVSGDEFAIVLPDAKDAVETATRLLEFLSRPYVVLGHPVTVGASLGVACAVPTTETALDLLHAADLALHQAEKEGRNRVCHFNPMMRERARNRHTLESDFRGAMAVEHMELQRALLCQQFEIHYQPQISLADGRLMGFEALVRWRHPERGLINPLEFIPMAEEIGLIDVLGEWVLRTACKDAQSWPVPLDGAPLRVAVNVSPMQLREGTTLLAGIRRALAESGLVVERLEIELTETALTMDIGETLTEMRRMGVSLALDDFGTGYSSLGRLRNHPFSRIKIDRSFTADFGRTEDENGMLVGEWMIRAIASLGVGLGLATVAEGIETLDQLKIARDAGCTEMQGYLVSRPVPGYELPELIERLNTAYRRKRENVGEQTTFAGLL